MNDANFELLIDLYDKKLLKFNFQFNSCHLFLCVFTNLISVGHHHLQFVFFCFVFWQTKGNRRRNASKQQRRFKRCEPFWFEHFSIDFAFLDETPTESFHGARPVQFQHQGPMSKSWPFSYEIQNNTRGHVTTIASCGPPSGCEKYGWH